MFRIKHKYEDMENSMNDFAEMIADATMLESQEFDFNLQALNSPGPGDEDEGEEENEGGGESTDEENPPLDETIVHSPVPPQSGGRPGA